MQTDTADPAGSPSPCREVAGSQSADGMQEDSLQKEHGLGHGGHCGPTRARYCLGKLYRKSHFRRSGLSLPVGGLLAHQTVL